MNCLGPGPMGVRTGALSVACRLVRFNLFPAAQSPQGCIESDGIMSSSLS